MKTVASLKVIFALLIPLGAVHGGSLKDCDNDLKATKTISPKLSSDGVFEGSATLEVVVLPSGMVESVKVLSSEWKPVGKHGSTKTADEIVSEAVLEWIYPETNEKCLKVVPIQIKIG